MDYDQLYNQAVREVTADPTSQAELIANDIAPGLLEGLRHIEERQGKKIFEAPAIEKHWDYGQRVKIKTNLMHDSTPITIVISASNRNVLIEDENTDTLKRFEPEKILEKRVLANDKDPDSGYLEIYKRDAAGKVIANGKAMVEQVYVWLAKRAMQQSQPTADIHPKLNPQQLKT